MRSPPLRPGGRARTAAAAAGAAPAAASPARAAAFEILLRVRQTDGHSDDLLHGPRLAKLSQPDRDLTTALVLGVLRWQIALDARLRPLLSRPDEPLPEPVAVALRLGAFQLLHLERIPAHAAVYESVQLAREAGHAHAAGMVNAVLRKVATLPAPRRPLVEPPAGMAERLGHPFWLVDGWMQQYGRAAAEAICAFDQKEPTYAPIFADEPRPAEEPDAEGRPPVMPIMDAGSRLVAELAAAAAPADTARVWDCCAAPGGKTLILAHRLPGTEILATDSNPRRAERLRQRLERALPGALLGAKVRVEQEDAAQLPAKYGDFDLVLCDVPCSGTGTLARNPEIRHRLHPEDFDRQAERQVRLLEGALERLKPGGRLVYSTCSLEREECEDVVDRVLRKRGSALRRVSVAELLSRIKRAGVLVADEVGAVRDKDLRTLPGSPFQADGFFACVIERVEA